MPWSGSTFERLYNWQQDRDNDINILAQRMDDEFDNYASGMEQLLLLDGSNSPTGNIDWGGFKLQNLADGTTANDAINLSQLQAVLAATSIENLIRNGGFDIAQRGTSFTTPASNSNTLDGWRVVTGAGTQGTFTISQVASTVPFTDTDDILSSFPCRYAIKWNQTVVGTSTTGCYLEQRIPNIRTFANSTLSLCYLSKNYGSGDGVEIGYNFGTGGSPTPPLTLTTQTWPASPAGQRIRQLAISGGGVGAAVFGTNNDDYIFIRIYPNAAGKNTETFAAYFTGVTVVALPVAISGDQALINNFPLRNPASELALCQRYFECSFVDNTTPADNVANKLQPVGTVAVTNALHCSMPFKVTKRVAPTVTIYRSTDGATAGQPAYYTGSAWADLSASSVPLATQQGFTVQGAATLTFGQSRLLSFNWTAEDPIF